MTTAGAVSSFGGSRPAVRPTSWPRDPTGTDDFNSGKIGGPTPAGAMTEFTAWPAAPSEASPPARTGNEGLPNKPPADRSHHPAGTINTSFRRRPLGSGPLHRGGVRRQPMVHRDRRLIGRVTPTGVFAEFPFPRRETNPVGSLRAPTGTYGSRAGGDRTIAMIDKPGGSVTEFLVPAAGSAPAWLGAGPDGTIWFTTSPPNAIGTITSGRAHHRVCASTSASATLHRRLVPMAT